MSLGIFLGRIRSSLRQFQIVISWNVLLGHVQFSENLHCSAIAYVSNTEAASYAQTRFLVI